MLKSNLNKIIGISVVFTLGILAGFYILLLTLNHYLLSQTITIQVDPINAVSILVNVLLVVYVTRILTRKNEEERVEKGLLIKRLESFQEKFDATITRFFCTEKLKLVTVNAELKTLRQDFNSICGLLKKYEFISEGNDICSNIDGNVRDVKDFFTDTPRNGESGQGDIEINQDEISLGSQNRQGIEESNMKIKDKIFDLVVVINRKK